MRKILRSFGTLASQVRRNRRDEADLLPAKLRERPSREDVLSGFRLILGRELDDENAIDAYMRVRSVAELRGILLNSEEFQERYKAMRPDTNEHPSLSMARDTLVLIHLMKTGGTSLRTMLEQQFSADRRCPIRGDVLHRLSVGELGHYDFFAGHFDRTALRIIPRSGIKTIALFREPRARLISVYRYFKSHPTRDEFADDVLIRFANELSAEEFFLRPEIRASSAIFNNYLISFGSSYAKFAQDQSSLTQEDFFRDLEEAKRQIHSLTALGITERFGQSVELICKTLSLPQPQSIEERNVTDKLTEVDDRLRRVEAVERTPRLLAALEALTVYDDELYQFAIREFDNRRAELLM